MTKRRDVVKRLMDARFVSNSGANHETFVKSNRITRVARHREISDAMCKAIYKQAGIK
ncbi:MAG: type II toxin-antitoxin system HicA family toxin [Coriobacteriales bacterium]|nr:type II toxin-antitoxin system HicA family toxin [Coriobacteriales bacterium]